LETKKGHRFEVYELVWIGTSYLPPLDLTLVMTNEVRRLYLIGAGASRPYRLPTLKTLLWHVSEHVGETERKILKQAAYEACGITLERPEDSPDFEEFLNRLDARSLLYLNDNELPKLSGLRPEAAAIALEGLREFIHQKCLSAEAQEGP
jgi:hypothetical protein